MNPSPAPVLEFALYDNGPARITVYDASGRQTRKIECGVKQNGKYSVRITGLAAGIYFVKLETPTDKRTGKFIVVK